MRSGSPAKTVWALKAAVILLFILGIIGSGVWLFVRKEPAQVRTGCDTNPALKTTIVSAGNSKVNAEIVESGEDKVRGLSGRNCLNPEGGMLFQYYLSGDYCFWMKEMRFSIDMIWLDDEKKIVTVKESVSPDTYPQSFCPDAPVRYVLEVPADFTDRADWGVGTVLSWQ